MCVLIPGGKWRDNASLEIKPKLVAGGELMTFLCGQCMTDCQWKVVKSHYVQWSTVFKLNQDQLYFVRAINTQEFVVLARQKRNKKDTKLQKKAPEPTQRSEGWKKKGQTSLKQSSIPQNKRQAIQIWLKECKKKKTWDMRYMSSSAVQ